MTKRSPGLHDHVRAGDRRLPTSEYVHYDCALGRLKSGPLGRVQWPTILFRNCRIFGVSEIGYSLSIQSLQYYSKYWWTLNGTTTTPYETNFMTIISIVSMIPNIFVMILNVVFASAYTFRFSSNRRNLSQRLHDPSSHGLSSDELSTHSDHHRSDHLR